MGDHFYEFVSIEELCHVFDKIGALSSGQKIRGEAAQDPSRLVTYWANKRVRLLGRLDLGTSGTSSSQGLATLKHEKNWTAPIKVDLRLVRQRDLIKESGRNVLVLGEVSLSGNFVRAHLLRDLHGVPSDKYQQAVAVLMKHQPSKYN